MSGNGATLTYYFQAATSLTDGGRGWKTLLKICTFVMKESTYNTIRDTSVLTLLNLIYFYEYFYANTLLIILKF